MEESHQIYHIIIKFNLMKFSVIRYHEIIKRYINIRRETKTEKIIFIYGNSHANAVDHFRGVTVKAHAEHWRKALRLNTTRLALPPELIDVH